MDCEDELIACEVVPIMGETVLMSCEEVPIIGETVLNEDDTIPPDCGDVIAREPIVERCVIELVFALIVLGVTVLPCDPKRLGDIELEDGPKVLGVIVLVDVPIELGVIELEEPPPANAPLVSGTAPESGAGRSGLDRHHWSPSRCSGTSGCDCCSRFIWSASFVVSVIPAVLA